MIKSIITYLVTQLPDTVKIVLATLVIAVLCIVYVRTFQIAEISAYVDPIQASNNDRFELMIKHSDKQFQLLHNDIQEIKRQNSEVIKLLIKP